jgi:acyl-CoA reductase-like NAD-dependent aldehyde dehydrogenase
VFIEESVYDQVIEGLRIEANNVKLGRGLDLSTQMGPLYVLFFLIY